MEFFKRIQPQLDEIVNDLFFSGVHPSDIDRILKNKMYWWDNGIFRKLKINVDNAELTFVGWLNAVEFLGIDVEAFNASLIESIESTVEMQWDIRMKEQQEDLNNELMEESKCLIHN